jgi:hypothetical protein
LFSTTSTLTMDRTPHWWSAGNNDRPSAPLDRSRRSPDPRRGSFAALGSRSHRLGRKLAPTEMSSPRDDLGLAAAGAREAPSHRRDAHLGSSRSFEPCQDVSGRHRTPPSVCHLPRSAALALARDLKC